MTFGYNIDVGNGHSSLLPSIFMVVVCYYECLDAKIAGMVCLLSNYQVNFLFIFFLFYFFLIDGNMYNIGND